MTGTPREVVVVGGGAAALGTVEALREAGYEGTLRLVAAEEHLPYDRPPLSKHVLTASDDAAVGPASVALRAPRDYDALDVDMVRGRSACGLDLAARRIALDDGAELPFDALVVATGVDARPLPGVASGAEVAVLRTLDDALVLRERLRSAAEVVVVGAGFLGVEIASAGRRHGAQVTVVEPASLPMVRQFGPAVGAMIRDLHERDGTRFRLGTGVREVLPASGGRSRVRLDDGSEIGADLVVAAIGSSPAVDWLTSSGLPLGPGVLVDAGCRAVEGVWAAGDVAAWTDPVSGVPRRFEHRTNATEQAVVVAANILGDRARLRPSHYFWSDQAGVRLQAVGAFPETAQFDVVSGTTEGDPSFVATATAEGAVVGVLGWRSPREFTRWRRTLHGASARVPA